MLFAFSLQLLRLHFWLKNWTVPSSKHCPWQERGHLATRTLLYRRSRACPLAQYLRRHIAVILPLNNFQSHLLQLEGTKILVDRLLERAVSPRLKYQLILLVWKQALSLKVVFQPREVLLAKLLALSAGRNV